MALAKSYDSIEDMFADMNAAQEVADAHVHPAQSALKVGDCFMRFAPEADVVIYGEVVDPFAWYVGKDLDANEGELRAELEFEKESRAQPHMQNYRFSKCYSPIVEDGELGDVHVCMVMPVTREVFEIARREHWPQRPDSSTDDVLLSALVDLFRGTDVVR